MRRNAVVASSDPDKSATMAKIIETVYANEPWFLVPTTTKYKSGVLIEFGGQNSGISIQHGTQFTGIARGTTPTVVHASELSDFSDPASLVDASLLRAMHSSPWIFLVLESTATTMNDWWNKTWDVNKELWPQRRCRLRPVFLPWFVGADIYPTSTWLKEHPMPKLWEPPEFIQKHAEHAERYVESNDLLSRHMPPNWRMSEEQKWFYFVEREEARKKKELNKFLSEMPATDVEAFQSSNISVFDTELMQNYVERVKHPVGVYGFVASPDLVPSRIQPDKSDIDPNLPPIEVRAHWNQTERPYEFRLVPLKWEGYPTDDGHGKLYIWEMPEPNEEYGFGVDSSEGIGHDQSVIEVLRKGTVESLDCQCAEFASQYVNAIDLWPLCLAVGTLYSTPVMGQIRQAKAVIECRNEADVTQLELRKRGWAHFHHWSRIDAKNISPQTAHKLGWYTNAWSRKQIFAWLIKIVKDSEIELNSPWLIHELKTLERDIDEQSLKAVFGGFDDRVMGLAICFFSLHYLEIRGGEWSIQRQREIEKHKQTSYILDAPEGTPVLSEEEWDQIQGVGVGDEYLP